MRFACVSWPVLTPCSRMVWPAEKVSNVPPAELVRLVKAARASADENAVRSIRSTETAKSVIVSAPPFGA